mmetsp:Transcript_7190/g.15685  ORF Transcript_7190/g.15685 Transcript_7190/m.15685 type:complete len:221 (-) Transcript_7190:165-827(-)
MWASCSPNASPTLTTSSWSTYDADTESVPTFNRANFSTDGRPVYTFDYEERSDFNEFVLGQTEQMSMKRGLKEFGKDGESAVHKEMKQLHDRKVPIPVDPSKLARGSKSAALRYLMFLKRKRDGTIKGRGCADGRPQRAYINKEESSSPTILLAKNGRGSSSKRTRHINIRYFFITDRIRRKEVSVEYCPTDEMIADFFSKPLQGSKFLKFRNMVLNIQE